MHTRRGDRTRRTRHLSVVTLRFSRIAHSVLLLSTLQSHSRSLKMIHVTVLSQVCSSPLPGPYADATTLSHATTQTSARCHVWCTSPSCSGRCSLCLFLFSGHRLVLLWRFVTPHLYAQATARTFVAGGPARTSQLRAPECISSPRARTRLPSLSRVAFAGVTHA